MRNERRQEIARNHVTARPACIGWEGWATREVTLREGRFALIATIVALYNSGLRVAARSSARRPSHARPCRLSVDAALGRISHSLPDARSGSPAVAPDTGPRPRAG